MVTISTIIPTRNRPTLLVERAIRSVMAQTFTDWECLIVGDDTDPDTVRLMAELCDFDHRFRFWNLPPTERPTDQIDRWRIGGTRAWNAGLAEARGDYVAYLADDDVLRPNHHTVLHAAIRSADLAFGYSILAGPFGALHSTRIYGRRDGLDPLDIVQGSWIGRRTIDFRVHTEPADETWDALMWRRVIGTGARFERVPEIVHEYHAAPENLRLQGLAP